MVLLSISKDGGKYILEKIKSEVLQLGGVMELVFKCTKEQKKEINGSCWIKDERSLAPGARSTV